MERLVHLALLVLLVYQDLKKKVMQVLKENVVMMAYQVIYIINHLLITKKRFTLVTGTFSLIKTFPRGKVPRLFFLPGEKLPDFRHFFPRGKESGRGKKVPVRVST